MSATVVEALLGAAAAGLAAQLFRERRRGRRAREAFRQLENAGHALAEAETTGAIARAAQEAMTGLGPLESFRLYFFDEADRVREVLTGPGGSPGEIAQDESHPDLHAAVEQTRLDLLAVTETPNSFAPRDLQASPRPRRRFRLPLYSGKRHVGYCEADYRSPLSSDAVDRLASVYRHITNAVASEKHFRLAARDGLTELFVRRFFDGRLAEEVERSRRYGRPCAVAQIDLDRFKALNDAHGHAAGDEALRRFSRVLRRAVREQDICGRRGGEEFAVVFPETNDSIASHVCERIRAALSRDRLLFEGKVLALTASFGVASFRSGESADRLLARADAALYRAKEEGRDRIVIAE